MADNGVVEIQERSASRWKHPLVWAIVIGVATLIGTAAGFAALGYSLGQSDAEHTAAVQIDRNQETIANAEATIASLEDENETLRAQEPSRPNDITSSSPCMTVEDATKFVGVSLTQSNDEQNGELCRFDWGNDHPGVPVNLACPQGFICSLQYPDTTVRVVLGDGVPMERSLVWGTWRYVPAYGLDARQRDPCRFLRDEQAYFIQDDPNDSNPDEPKDYVVVPEGFTC